ncbi:FAD-dependent oxidoreductase [Streptomyces sp. NPDC002623]
MRILVSGAGVAGPVLAYWLTRHGFSVTVVERAPTLRKTGGHAVALFRPAMNISEKMGVLPRVEERATGTNRITVYREGSRRPVGDARALFLFRSERELDYHRHDVPRQKELLRGAFAGMHAHVDRWLDELDRTPAFYFDSITQLRMDTWSQGRVTLVGDAGYCPGPAVGGSTSLAVVGAYVLAGEPARAGGDHERAFPAYERAMAEHPARGPQPRPRSPHHQERAPLRLRDRRRLSAVAHRIRRSVRPRGRPRRRPRGGVAPACFEVARAPLLLQLSEVERHSHTSRDASTQPKADDGMGGEPIPGVECVEWSAGAGPSRGNHGHPRTPTDAHGCLLVPRQPLSRFRSLAPERLLPPGTFNRSRADSGPVHFVEAPTCLCSSST